MKILFVHQNFPGQFPHLAPAMARRGHDVLALTDQASKDGVNGTPTIKVNGKEIKVHDLASVQAAIDAAVAKGPAPHPSPTPSPSPSGSTPPVAPSSGTAATTPKPTSPAPVSSSP